MSTKLNGRHYSKPGTRVPTSLLQEALRWENFRSQLAPILGMPNEGMEAAGLARHYEERLFHEVGIQ